MNSAYKAICYLRIDVFAFCVSVCLNMHRMSRYYKILDLVRFLRVTSFQDANTEIVGGELCRGIFSSPGTKCKSELSG